MASIPSETKLSLRLMLNKYTQKLIYAEGSKEFVDFLFSLLKLPLGTVSGLLTSANMVGSFGNLYTSVESLSDTYLDHGKEKQSLLKPGLISTDPIPLLPTELYSTTSWMHYTPAGFRSGRGIRPLDQAGYVKGVVTYTITDDLKVEPVTPSSIFTLLTKAGVQDLGILQERIVRVGTDEGLKLLREAMVSRNVLTNVFLLKTAAERSVLSV